MTSSLRMKRRIIRHGWNWSGRITTSFLGLTLLLLAAKPLPAQQPQPPLPELPELPKISQPASSPAVTLPGYPSLPPAAIQEKTPVHSKKQVPSQRPQARRAAAKKPPLQAPTQKPTLPQLPPSPQPNVRQTAMQAPQPARAAEDAYSLTFKMPGPEELFRLESDAALFERMRQQARSAKKKGRIEFPPNPVLSTHPYYGRAWPPMRQIAEPYYVCHRRTYFAQKNFERYGWDLGIVTPVICAGKFFTDVFFLPYHMGTEPWRHYECNTGYCLPGDPVPLYLYPPRLSLTGAVAQVGVLAGGFYVFP